MLYFAVTLEVFFNVDLEGREGGKELGKTEKGETVIKIYCKGSEGGNKCNWNPTSEEYLKKKNG